MRQPPDPDSLGALLVDMVIGLFFGIPLGIGLFVATVIVALG